MPSNSLLPNNTIPQPPSPQKLIHPKTNQQKNFTPSLAICKCSSLALLFHGAVVRIPCSLEHKKKIHSSGFKPVVSRL